MEGAAWISLVGVIVGAVVSLVASVVVPWVRDSLDRRRREREQDRIERRDALLEAMAALLRLRHSGMGMPGMETARAMAEFGAARNALVVRLTSGEKAVDEALLALLALVSSPRRGIEDKLGEVMEVLTLWARGDIASDRIISEIEKRAGLEFSDDHTTFRPVSTE